MTDFQQLHNRKETNSLKWDQVNSVFQTDDILPMWVADMDFKAPSAVNEAIKQRAMHGIYGYTVIDAPIKDSIKSWIHSEHQWQIDTDWLLFSPGVITSLHTAIQTFTNSEDKILIQTPVYTPFFNLIKDGNRQVVENPLHFNGEKYEIDFDDLEEKLQQGVKAFILCSPHNPVGRVWTKEELIKIANLCVTYNVYLFSDEIHADLVFPDYTHVPIASISDEVAAHTITFMSPTKTFNLAGLQASYIVIPNKKLRIKLQKQLGLQGFNMLNTIGTIALQAAYAEGKPWLQEVLQIISDNKAYVRETFAAELDNKITIINSEATYLLWMDCRKLSLSDKELQTFMINEAKVGMNAGSSYGSAGEQFMRLNIACPKETLKEGVNRIIQAVKGL